MRLTSTLVVLFLCAFLTACAGNGGPAPSLPASSAIDASHAQCLVCKHNADLACVDLAVTKDTPRYEYNGQTYYFCSNDCRSEFVRNPTKYIPK